MQKKFQLISRQKYILLPVKNELSKNDSAVLRYAADSNDEKIIKAISFISPDKNYLVRIIDAKDKKLLYVFSVEDEIVKDFTINLYPPKTSYILADNSAPLELPADLEIEKVEITLN